MLQYTELSRRPHMKKKNLLVDDTVLYVDVNQNGMKMTSNKVAVKRPRINPWQQGDVHEYMSLQR